MAFRVQSFVKRLQNEICDAFEALDGVATFQEDRWERDGGGGGLTRVLEGGPLLEKAGVNTSAVMGVLPERMAAILKVPATQFFATGVSLVVHPRSPYVPTVHANFRYFALGEDLNAPIDQWFGGGADLTPYYPYLEDAQHFHRTWKEICDRHELASYAGYKKHCDEYFYLKHRKEARGVGGIFFDYLRSDPEEAFAFLQDAGAGFLDAYLPIANGRKDMPYGEREKHYHEMRRGRYVEFNLLFDRGTKFGIETDGRTESILMSLPPAVQWHYDWSPEPDSPEEEAQWFFQPRDWLSL
ncbi:MAG: oxygen-dependent coproporphyrinogen oxidase [Rhodothermales bacterium]